jgi:tRNA threonylcarbamoyladenosine biosynthesis protein TsaB
MRILAIDTTSEFGSLAIHQDGQTLEEVPLRAPEGFSQVLFGYIDALLRRHDWDLSDIDVFASAVGPGSFTGVRVGLTAAKGLADAMGRAALGVSNLQALAEFGTTAARGVVMDARRGEIYAAIYGSDLEIVSPEVVVPFPVWLGGLAEPPQEIISPDFSAFRPSFGLNIPVREQRTLAAAIARIAERSQSVDPALLDANYVRRSDAELFWKDRPATPSL